MFFFKDDGAMVEQLCLVGGCVVWLQVRLRPCAELVAVNNLHQFALRPSSTWVRLMCSTRCVQHGWFNMVIEHGEYGQ
uniref:Secreted protein n=1 Tax=Meloidogyne javanica TaxID=6303 RepID=A0A915M799_MELJA